MNCPSCKAENTDDNVFCVGCGYKLTQAHKISTTQEISTMANPPGFQGGVFPRNHLIGGETLCWEGRPDIIAYLSKGIVWMLISIILLLTGSDLLTFFGVIILIASVLSMVVGAISWASTSYALTDKRVMAVYGVFTKKFAECNHDRIQNTTVLMPFLLRLFGNGVVTFATSGFMGGINTRSADKMQSSGGAIVWYGVKSPNEVKRYAVDIIEQSKKLAKKRELEEMASIMRDGKAAEAKIISSAVKPYAPAKSAKGSVEEQLQNVQGLREKNLISEEEYEALRKKILAEI